MYNLLTAAGLNSSQNGSQHTGSGPLADSVALLQQMAMYRLESHRLLVLSSGYALYLASCLICQCDRLHVRSVQVAPQNGQEIFHFGGVDTGLRRLLFIGSAIAVKSRSTSPKACDAWSLRATGRGFEAFTEARTVGHTQKSRGASQQRRTDPVRKLYSLPVRNHHGGHASTSITA